MIVTGTAQYVLGYGGDDLICVTGGAKDPIPSINAGPGNDVVDTTAADLEYISTVLGEGADVYFGGAASDAVTAGTGFNDGAPLPDNERDVIDTGAGGDNITSTGSTVPNSDVITAGTATTTSSSMALWRPTASSTVEQGATSSPWASSRAVRSPSMPLARPSATGSTSSAGPAWKTSRSAWRTSL